MVGRKADKRKRGAAFDLASVFFVRREGGRGGAADSGSGKYILLTHDTCMPYMWEGSKLKRFSFPYAGGIKTKFKNKC